MDLAVVDNQTGKGAASDWPGVAGGTLEESFRVNGFFLKISVLIGCAPFFI
jgi:hypothetical protein